MRRFVRTTLSRALELYREKAPRGEFVLVVEGASQQQEQFSFDQALELVSALVDKGEPLSKAAKDVAHQTGFKKRRAVQPLSWPVAFILSKGV